MRDPVEIVSKLIESASVARFRICGIEGEEHPDRSWQRVTCHIHREDVSWSSIPLIYVIGALSFHDARPRGASEMDYSERDEWLFSDLLTRLHLERDALTFDSDYVRGRMMKTTISIDPVGTLVVSTRNRHEMAVRWLRTIKGKKHLRLIG